VAEWTATTSVSTVPSSLTSHSNGKGETMTNETAKIAGHLAEVITAMRKADRPWLREIKRRLAESAVSSEDVVAYCETQYEVRTNKYGGRIVVDRDNPFAALRNALVD